MGRGGGLRRQGDVGPCRTQEQSDDHAATQHLYTQHDIPYISLKKKRKKKKEDQLFNYVVLNTTTKCLIYRYTVTFPEHDDNAMSSR